ncbi:hypothetical protein C490_08581 [Natronobacterium gregoryi SP2]|uniref:Uncharacterized protein n=1 Tax=Natronobacterium gregoryi (strain ATCC 43098 / DSM 3393 / CCM 3738 / CIP 104747 / IAM 13177 / JCM 8860 / NBRC 102187 / NCIMB 2189 / SP2) TaxID=797304 RepID=L9Y807_NATGS|nr:hypothetical protein C490_08581 [Natronobacterium gregoryi SP2]
MTPRGLDHWNASVDRTLECLAQAGGRVPEPGASENEAVDAVLECAVDLPPVDTHRVRDDFDADGGIDSGAGNRLRVATGLVQQSQAIR